MQKPGLIQQLAKLAFSSRRVFLEFPPCPVQPWDARKGSSSSEVAFIDNGIWCRHINIETCSIRFVQEHECGASVDVQRRGRLQFAIYFFKVGNQINLVHGPQYIGRAMADKVKGLISQKRGFQIGLGGV